MRAGQDRRSGRREHSTLKPTTPSIRLTEADFQLMLTLADQMSLVMHNAYLYQRLASERTHIKQFNDQLLALQQISTAVVSHLDLRELLDFVARSAAELLGGNSASIFLFDEHNSLTIHGSYELQPETVQRTIHPAWTEHHRHSWTNRKTYHR